MLYTEIITVLSATENTNTLYGQNAEFSNVKPGGAQWRTQEFCSGGGVNKFSGGQRTETTGIWGRSPSQGV